MGETRDYIEMLAKFREENMPTTKLKYNGIEAFVLAHGRDMGDMAPLPEDVGNGTKKECFKNAMELAMERGWTYCEGYASSAIPTMHAWCLDDEGNVIDPTWDEGRDYIGVEIPTDYALKTILRRGAYGVIENMEEGYPLLTGEDTLPGTEDRA
jgi:hypothetical protein